MNAERTKALYGLLYHIIGWYPFNGDVSNAHTPGINDVSLHASSSAAVYVPGRKSLGIRRNSRFNHQLTFLGTAGQPVVSFAGWCRFPDDPFYFTQFIDGATSGTRQRVQMYGDDLYWETPGPSTSAYTVSLPAFLAFEDYRKNWTHYAWSTRFGASGWFKSWLNGQPVFESTFVGGPPPTNNFYLYAHSQSAGVGPAEFDEVVISLTPWRDMEIEALYNDGYGASYPKINQSQIYSPHMMGYAQ